MVNPVTSTTHVSDSVEPTGRTAFGRKPERGSYERADLYAVLDAAIVGHVGIAVDGQPYVMPVGYARQGDAVIIHGSTGSRLFRALADGAPACFTVTHLDGVVLARSAFASSMNYRSAVVLGTARRLEGQEELDALMALTAHLLPGREHEARAASKKEQAATMTLALPLEEFSIKMRTGGPNDEPEDLEDPEMRKIWAGHVPITTVYGAPIASPTNLPGTPVPGYIATW